MALIPERRSRIRPRAAPEHWRVATRMPSATSSSSSTRGAQASFAGERRGRVHGVVEAEEVRELVEGPHRQQAHHGQGLDHPRHLHLRRVAADGVEDAVGDLLLLQHREQQGDRVFTPWNMPMSM